MLNLLFIKKLTHEQEEQLLQVITNTIVRYEHDIFECGHRCELKVTVYEISDERGEQIMKELDEKGFQFGSYFTSGDPFLTDEVAKKENEWSESPTEESMKAETQAIEQKFMSETLESALNPDNDVKPVRMVAGNNQQEDAEIENEPDSPPSSPPPQQILLPLSKLTEFEKKQEQLMGMMESLKKDFNRRIDKIQSAPSTPMVPAPSSSRNSARNTAQSEAVTAKHELLANGLRCDKCSDVIKAGELAALLSAARDHVMGHFDRENPRFKRFHCKVCQNPPISTNFVDEFEKHVKKHGGSLPETRIKVTENQTTKPYLKLVCEIANKCFSEVFEKTPPEISTIKAIDTPVNAKSSVFPALDSLFCMRYRIPVACRGRKSVPSAFVTLN